VPLTANIIPSDGPIVAIPRPPLFVLAGNVTLQGLAVDCSTGQPATRVAIYDGVQPSAPYVADAAIDPAVDAAAACVNASGTPVGGFMVIFNSRMLDDGPHTLRFEAQYPGGKSAVTTAEIFLENLVPYESQDRE
jgi:hypothetical protein